MRASRRRYSLDGAASEPRSPSRRVSASQRLRRSRRAVRIEAWAELPPPLFVCAVRFGARGARSLSFTFCRVTMLLLRAPDVGTQVALRHRRADLFLQADGIDVLQPNETVEMRTPASMVSLGRCLPRAILEFQPREEVHHRVAAGVVLAAQDVPLPLLPSLLTLLVAARQDAGDDLKHAMGEMQRLEDGQLEPPLQQLLHLVTEELVVGCAPLVGRHREEDRGEANLPDQILCGAQHGTRD